jgi:hypothetical protein
MAERQHFGGPGRQMSGEMPSSSSSPPSSGVSLSPRESSVTFSLIASPTGRTDDLNGTSFFPKTEPADSELGDDQDEDAINIKTEPGEGSSSVTTVTGRRPRGRPRKSRPESLTSPKSAKGRTKTGCFTCRKRKKKCDERKPACKNCEQNNVVCEGYPPLALWQGGRERKVAQSTSSNYHIHYVYLYSLANVVLDRRVWEERGAKPLPQFLFPVEEDIDWIFYKHYESELSRRLNISPDVNNPFIGK